MNKSVDFKEIILSISDFIDNESFEYLLEEFGIERTKDRDFQSIILTVVKVETKSY